MNKIKPIETVYKGYRFRSRLEARWAVFFDNLGILWEYEKEGFDLGEGIYYLPDFWLPEVKMWAEVKPEEWEYTKDKNRWKDMWKVAQLARQSKYGVLMLIGVPEDKPYYGVSNIESNPICHYCLTQYKNYPKSEGRFYSMPGGPDDSHFKDTAKASKAAKSARFEFNERSK